MKISKWIVVNHQEGLPDVKKIYQKVEENIDVNLRDDEMLLRTIYVSLDPYLHGIAKDTPKGQHMGADSIMQVLDAGEKARFQPGDLVQGFGGWRSHLISNGEPALWQTGTFPMVFPAFRKLDENHYDDILPLSSALGVMGGPGLTAYASFTKFLEVKENNSLVISGASGAIGEILGQLAKLAGARVVGTTGSLEKAQYLMSLGFDEIINYKENNDYEKMHKALIKALPQGVDRYFDQIGGHITDAVFSMLNVYSRVAVCWQWAVQVNQEFNGPRLFPYIMFPRATIRGIFSLEWFTDQNWAELHSVLGGLIRNKKISYRQTIYEGFDNIPNAYQNIFIQSEKHRGKVLVKI